MWLPSSSPELRAEVERLILSNTLVQEWLKGDYAEISCRLLGVTQFVTSRLFGSGEGGSAFQPASSTLEELEKLLPALLLPEGFSDSAILQELLAETFASFSEETRGTPCLWYKLQWTVAVLRQQFFSLWNERHKARQAYAEFVCVILHDRHWEFSTLPISRFPFFILDWDLSNICSQFVLLGRRRNDN
jgi:hypothetical protein